MADSNDQNEQNLQLRIALNDAYAYVEGQKTIQSFSSLTFEECLDAQIERLVGADTPSRPNVYNRITKTLNDVKQAVANIKAMPDDAFKDADPTTNVNSPV